MTRRKLPGASFEVTANEGHVFLTVTDIGGDQYFLPLTVDVAGELGKQLLAGVLAVGGQLV
ncbi:hypothetical protein BOH72_14080 [Mycobacterium sp. WY10]|nr:hypothetical protein BOH72_14080 [Mycobacterium sp. WY10]